MTRNELLLIQLGEECNEIAGRISKAQRFGLTEVQPGQPQNNVERIHNELMDLMGVYSMLQDSGVLPNMEFPLIEEKKKKVERFLDYSRQCGILTD